jgi:hypothetical protein
LLCILSLRYSATNGLTNATALRRFFSRRHRAVRDAKSTRAGDNDDVLDANNGLNDLYLYGDDVGKYGNDTTTTSSIQSHTVPNKRTTNTQRLTQTQKHKRHMPTAAAYNSRVCDDDTARFHNRLITQQTNNTHNNQHTTTHDNQQHATQNHDRVVMTTQRDTPCLPVAFPTPSQHIQHT